jgi:hypothetical protein
VIIECFNTPMEDISDYQFFIHPWKRFLGSNSRLIMRCRDISSAMKTPS